MLVTAVISLPNSGTEPKSGFRIAFNMFDTDGNQRVDRDEFLVVSIRQISSTCTRWFTVCSMFDVVASSSLFLYQFLSFPSGGSRCHRFVTRRRCRAKLTNIMSGSLERNETDQATRKLVRMIMIFMILYDLFMRSVSRFVCLMFRLSIVLSFLRRVIQPRVHLIHTK